jgi:rRNA maturation endonuclease Nob1
MTTPWIIFILSKTVALISALVLLTWRGANVIAELRSENKQLKSELIALKEQNNIIQKVTEEALSKVEDRIEKMEGKIEQLNLAVRELIVLTKLRNDHNA